MQTLKDRKPAVQKPEVPEDVRAESDIEERRLNVAADKLPPRGMVPEDVLSERDREFRAAQSMRPDDSPVLEEEE